MNTRLDSILCAVTACGLAAPAAAGPGEADYQHAFQEPYGDPAAFYVTGPATGASPDPQGDAILQKVEYATGDIFIHFYPVDDVYNITYAGPKNKFRVCGGSNCTVGLNHGALELPDADGSPGTTPADEAIFRDLIRTAQQNKNLNNYFDTGGNSSIFSMIMKFDIVVKDNDPGPDEFGEILYFERGAGDGNSWLKIRAVDEDGNGLGPWLAIGPSETVYTDPVATVLNNSQTIGASAIDISRLGVDEFQYLQMSNDVSGDPAYTGGGDLQPDFKLMAVITDEVDLARLGD